jgi:hypothetical protein
VAAFTERDLENPEPLRFDREIARTARGAARFARRLEAGEDVSQSDPFASTRLVTGRSAFQAVSELDPSDPLRASLLRWIYRLAEARINLPTILRVAAERRHVEHVVSNPERGRFTLSDVLRRGLAEPRRREAWFESYLAQAETLGTAVAVRWERRKEVAARLGLPAPDAMDGVGADVYAAAEHWLTRTDDAFGSVAPSSFGELVTLALAERAPCELSRHLVPSTVLDYFRETDLLRDVDLDPGPLPEPMAPTSIMRGLARVFASFVDATAPRNQPFVVAHDPYGLRRRTSGALFATLPLGGAFARRSLGVDAAKLTDYERHLAGALLVHTRASALRVLVRRAAFEGRKTLREFFESGTERALGVPLPGEAAGAMLRLHDDELQRFAAMLLAASRAAEQRDEHDDDWYRNPRAIEQLRDEARFPPVSQTTDDALRDGADALYAMITARL